MDIVYQNKDPVLLTKDHFDVNRYYEGGKIIAGFQKESGEIFDGELVITKIIDKKCYGDDGFLIDFEAKILPPSS